VDSKQKHYSYQVYADPAYARQFDQDRFGGPVGEMINDVHMNRLWGLLPKVSGLKILDVGAGTGRFSLPLAAHGAHVTASDASPAMLEIAREKVLAAGLKVQFQIADALALPFANASYDIVLSSRMLMHVTNWRKALNEMCRVASKMVIADYPPRRSFAGLAPVLLPLIKRRRKQTQVYHVLSHRAVRMELIRNGFRETEWNTQFALPFFVHRRLQNPGLSMKLEQVLAGLGMLRLFGAPVMFRAERMPEDLV